MYHKEHVELECLYTKDYTEGRAAAIAAKSRSMDLPEGPRVYSYYGRKLHDQLVAECDVIAEQYGGKVTGLVDFARRESKIELILPWFDARGEGKYFVEELLGSAWYFTIRPVAEQDTIQLTIYTDCFMEKKFGE